MAKEKEALDQIPTPELEKKIKTTKFVMGLLIGMAIAMVIITAILLYQNPRATTGLISCLALIPLYFVIRKSLKDMEQELARRSSQG